MGLKFGGLSAPPSSQKAPTRYDGSCCYTNIQGWVNRVVQSVKETRQDMARLVVDG